MKNAVKRRPGSANSPWMNSTARRQQVTVAMAEVVKNDGLMPIFASKPATSDHL